VRAGFESYVAFAAIFDNRLFSVWSQIMA